MTNKTLDNGMHLDRFVRAAAVHVHTEFVYIMKTYTNFVPLHPLDCS